MAPGREAMDGCTSERGEQSIELLLYVGSVEDKKRGIVVDWRQESSGERAVEEFICGNEREDYCLGGVT